MAQFAAYGDNMAPGCGQADHSQDGRRPCRRDRV
jgi:hypothetical protein